MRGRVGLVGLLGALLLVVCGKSESVQVATGTHVVIEAGFRYYCL
jgi:hypothetical protein